MSSTDGDIELPTQTVVNIPSDTFLNDTLDGVKWNGDKEEKRKFTYAFTEVLRTCGLTGRSKLIIKERYLNLYEKYLKRSVGINLLYNSSRIIATVFGIVVPALITLDNEISDKTDTSRIIGYVTFTMSLTVTIINALLDLFQVNKQSYTYSLTKDNLETEGWLFLSLTGRYHKYDDHSECWRKFLYKVEKLNVQAINSSIAISEINDEKKSEVVVNRIQLEDESHSHNRSHGGVSDNIIYVNN